MIAAKPIYRWLFFAHRWIGIGSCLLFCIWFLSGLVMLHIPYPSLSSADKLAGAEPIDWRQVEALPPGPMAQAPRLALLMRDGVPVWRAQRQDGSWALAPARHSFPLAPVDAAYARRTAVSFSGQHAGRAQLTQRDQWTVAGGFDAHRPLWKVELNDALGTILYLSSATGEPVQRTTRSQRAWNWLGSVPHWIYPTLLRQHAGGWRQVVLWVSGPCIAAALSGIWIGLMRARLGARRYAGRRMSPYRGWMLWHHVAGLAGGLFLLAWIFSGWLSVDPGRLFAAGTGSTGEAYTASAAPDDRTLARLRHQAPLAAMLIFQHNAGLATATVLGPDGSSAIWALPSIAPAPLANKAIIQAAAALVPGGRMTEARLLRAPDSYWYKVDGDPQLPVLQLRFDDSRQTWLYLDSRSGELLLSTDERRRLYRWLFDMLHRWDLGVMARHPQARIMLIWIASLIGLVTAGSGLVLGWRRLARRQRLGRAEVKIRPAAAAAAPRSPA